MDIRIMIVEDDAILSAEVGTFLMKWGYEAFCVTDFKNIMPEYEQFHPHLVLMDVTLPFYDGFYWCRQIRRLSQIPVIFISSRNDERDKIMGMAQGGDDYVEKPFGLGLLKAKVEAIVRRTYEYQVIRDAYIHEGFYYDYGTSVLYYNENMIELTKSERKIIGILLENSPDVVSREELMMELWNTDEYVSDTTLTVLISRLRSKIRALSQGCDLIFTKKGQGYFIPFNTSSAASVFEEEHKPAMGNNQKAEKGRSGHDL